MSSRELSDDERALVGHITMWGSDGYPVERLGRSWHWRDWRSVRGAPTTYKTKRAATAAFEAFFDLLLELLAEESIRKHLEARRPAASVGIAELERKVRAAHQSPSRAPGETRTRGPGPEPSVPAAASGGP